MSGEGRGRGGEGDVVGKGERDVVGKGRCVVSERYALLSFE